MNATADAGRHARSFARAILCAGSLASLLAATTAAAADALPDAAYSKPYEFTDNWFSSNIPVWSTLLGPLRGKPNVRYLEVGVHEGRSLLWVLENVLTHPTSRLTAVDVAPPARLFSNIEKSGEAQRITTLKGRSQKVLRGLPLSSFDVIYIDGSHVAPDVLADAVQSFELLKDGGLMIFDDYTWDGTWTSKNGEREGQELPDQLKPRLGVDAFLAAYRYDFKVLHRGYQLILRKTGYACRNGEMQGYCSPFGQYLYDWSRQRLLAADASRAVEVSPAEREMIESILRSKEAGEKTLKSRKFLALRERLQLEL